MLSTLWVIGGLGVLLLVGLIIWQLRRSSEATLPTVAPEALRTTATLEAEVAQLLARSGKLQAIRWARAQTGMDLRAAKEYVERIAAGQPTSGTPPSFVAGDLDDELRALVARGQTIEAIRRVRDTTGMGLKDAKDYVDQLRSRDQASG